MMLRLLSLCALIFGAAAAFLLLDREAPSEAIAQSADTPTTVLPGGTSLASLMVGHELREDDMPSLAASPDGAFWLAWMSFDGEKDDIGIRRYGEGKWGTLQWVPGTSGDSWMPQTAVDARNRVWIVWTQRVDDNWDIYARRYDPQTLEWGKLLRLSEDPLPDINPSIASDGKGGAAVAWQGFRGKTSSIFLSRLSGDAWSPPVRLTQNQANDWSPSVALSPDGTAYVGYDSYRNGNYDIFLATVKGGQTQESAVAATPRFEARASVAVDSSGRPWVAWEEGAAGWGKDQGYVMRGRGPGVVLGGQRRVRVRCWDGGAWKEPAAGLETAFGGETVYQPRLFPDAAGSLWVTAQRRLLPPERPGTRANNGYWEYWVTRLDGGAWTEAFPLPAAKGRSSTRMSAAAHGQDLWMAWPTDNRAPGMYHRPLRQKIYVAKLDSTQSKQPELRAAAQENVEVKPGGHADEPGDLTAIRSYTVNLDGKPNSIVRGDFHRHTELSWDGGGSADGSLEDFYRYMIDAGAMDFGASTDHQGGAWRYWWWYSQKLTDMYHIPGSYVAVYGFERSAVFPNGHRNIFFSKRSDAMVIPFFLKSGANAFAVPPGPMGDEPGIGTGELVTNDTKLLYEEVRRRNAVAISHTSGTRMGTDWRDNDPDMEPVVEIYQGARTNYEALDAPLVAEPSKDGPHVARAGYQPEGMVKNAWQKGYKLGIITSSDHGSTHISYAMVYTPDRTRQGILDAIRKRHTYGAMDNIILDVKLGKYFMGDEFRMTRPEPIRIKVRGTKPIANVTILRDSEVVYSTQPGRQTVELQYTDRGDWNGRHYIYVRVEQEDGTLAWSSPFFLNYN